MTAKQYLMGYKRLESRYKAAVEEYRSVEDDMTFLKSPGFDERVKSSAKNDPIGDIVIKMEDQKGKIGLKMVKYKSQMFLIRNQISEMENTDYDFCMILLLRYVLYKDWKFICSNLNVSRSQAYVIHGKALNEFDRIFGSQYKEN